MGANLVVLQSPPWPLVPRQFVVEIGKPLDKLRRSRQEALSLAIGHTSTVVYHIVRFHPFLFLVTAPSPSPSRRPHVSLGWGVSLSSAVTKRSRQVQRLGARG